MISQNVFLSQISTHLRSADLFHMSFEAFPTLAELFSVSSILQ